ncbi:hypothetical protein GCM10009069_25650 [Algimonas arctica]|uniref:peptide-methionine (R)-S-oxide reductase n=2 Tax=Algimonas arctica TaxID=1479486 RepID=A0A8J3CST1_9PROT|nr:peptide-methionine (R)-S-oxide reductase MsrB [Algimonas arctica]GHB01632.1 hypothetical protein GCM10009069_25650 [Algimonas arctica]
MFDRRTFTFGGSAFVLAACSGATSAKTLTTDPLSDRKTDVMTATDTNIDWANLSNEDWKNRLTEEEFHVLRKEGTERASSSPLDSEKRAGTFVCAGCALPLFKSDMKFDSGTGWPSFFTMIEGALETKRDFKIVIPRTEYHCSRCGGHQGHVFKDGPRPTGLRYCNNGVALDFIPDAT